MSASFSLKAAIEQIIESLAAGRLTLDVAQRFFTLDCIIHPAPSLPFGGLYRGPAGFLTLQDAMRSTWRNFGGELIGLWAHDNLDGDAMLLAQIRGEAAKGPFQMLLGEYWKFRGGLVCEIVPLYWDAHQLNFLSEASS